MPLYLYKHNVYFGESIFSFSDYIYFCFKNTLSYKLKIIKIWKIEEEDEKKHEK